MVLHYGVVKSLSLLKLQKMQLKKQYRIWQNETFFVIVHLPQHMLEDATSLSVNDTLVHAMPNV